MQDRIKPQCPPAGGLAIGLVTFPTGQLALDKVLSFTFSIAVVLCEHLHSVKAFLKIWQIKGHSSEFSYDNLVSRLGQMHFEFKIITDFSLKK